MDYYRNPFLNRQVEKKQKTMKSPCCKAKVGTCYSSMSQIGIYVNHRPDYYYCTKCGLMYKFLPQEKEVQE